MEKRLISFAVIVGLLVLVVFGWAYFDARTKSQQAQDLARQLRGDLTVQEKAFQQANVELGLVQSKLTTQAQVESRYKEIIDQKDAESVRLAKALETFRREHQAQVDSLLQANLKLQSLIRDGTGTAVVTLNPDDPNAAPITSYSYSDSYKRFHLTDPDISVPGNETLAVDQRFRLTAVVLRQNQGNLKAQQVSLQEVVAEGTGWKPVATAQIIDSEFTYAPDPPAPPESWFDPRVVAAVGTTFQRETPVNLGVGAQVVRVQDFRAGAVLYSDLKSLSGTGLAPEVSWQPRWGDRQFNVGIAAGVGISTDLSLHPYFGAVFVLY